MNLVLVVRFDSVDQKKMTRMLLNKHILRDRTLLSNIGVNEWRDSFARGTSKRQSDVAASLVEVAYFDLNFEGQSRIQRPLAL